MATVLQFAAPGTAMLCQDRWVQTLSVLETLPSGWHGVFLLVTAFRRFLRSSWCRFGATGSTWGYLRSSIGSWGHMRAVSGHGVLLGLSTGQLGVTGCISGSRGRIGFVLGSWKHRGAMYVKRGFMGSLRNHPGATKPLIIFAWRVCRGVILGPRWVHRPILGSRGYPMPSFQSRRTGSQTAQVSPTLDGGAGETRQFCSPKLPCRPVVVLSLHCRSHASRQPFLPFSPPPPPPPLSAPPPLPLPPFRPPPPPSPIQRTFHASGSSTCGPSGQVRMWAHANLGTPVTRSVLHP